MHGVVAVGGGAKLEVGEIERERIEHGVRDTGERKGKSNEVDALAYKVKRGLVSW